MEPKKTVYKTHITCARCKTCILKAVSKLDGINEISIDAEKNTMKVIGTVDPICVVDCLRKAGKPVTIDTVGPAKKEDDKPKSPSKELCEKFLQCYDPCCNPCRPSPFLFREEVPSCTIV